MKLLWRAPDPQLNRSAQSIAIFGSGLIGGQILSVLRRGNDWKVSDIPYDWQDNKLRAAQRRDLRSRLESLCAGCDIGDHQLDIVWAAGRAGFAASEEELETERITFEEACRDFNDLAQTRFPGRARMHLISSAGGLFEGQRLVSRKSVPAPRRPYGYAKLAQEDELRTTGAALAPFIYRPSSVYGYSKPGDRIGLIVALLGGAVRNRETVIYGRPSTLRDFVLVDDVARFMISKIFNPDSQPGTFVLASGKPTSMVEVIAQVRKLQDRNLMLRYVVGDSNVADNTFSQDCLPADWSATPLDIGMARVSDRIKSFFELG